MRNLILSITVLASLVAAGCKGTPVPVEYSAVCDKANDKKYVEVVGFFRNKGSAMCSKRGSEAMRCPIEFWKVPGGGKAMLNDLYFGEEKNGVTNPEEKGLKIKDDTGAVVENNEKVKITGRIFNFVDSSAPDALYLGCSITVDKIEKLNL